MKKFHLLAFLTGCLLALIGALLFWPSMAAREASSTTLPLLGTFAGLYYVMLVGGAALILGNTPYLIFGRRTSRECTMATSLSAVGMAACVGVGVYCVYTFVTCVLFSSSNYRHPIAIPASFSVGVGALVAFILLTCLYFKRRWRRGVVGLIMDVWSGLVVIVPCFLACLWLHGMISASLRTF